MGGSSSKSSSSQQSSVLTQDRRAVADNGSSSVTGDGNTLNVMDGGAVAGALEVAKLAAGSAFDLAKSSQVSAQGAQASAIDFSTRAAQDALGFAKSAVDLSSQKATDSTQERPVLYATLALGAVVALSFLKS